MNYKHVTLITALLCVICLLACAISPNFFTFTLAVGLTTVAVVFQTVAVLKDSTSKYQGDYPIDRRK